MEENSVALMNYIDQLYDWFFVSLYDSTLCFLFSLLTLLKYLSLYNQQVHYLSLFIYLFVQDLNQGLNFHDPLQGLDFIGESNSSGHKLWWIFLLFHLLGDVFFVWLLLLLKSKWDKWERIDNVMNKPSLFYW